MRGKPVNRDVDSYAAGLIPAYAGKTGRGFKKLCD